MALNEFRAAAWRRLLWAGCAAAAVLLAADSMDAHKAVTSKYTYNTDVFPILRDRCGSCHRDGGVAPMSLLTYNQNGGSGGAYAWAESMREMLTAGVMPPWYADPAGPPVKNNHTLTARELDTLITWAAGGTPEGDPAHRPTAPAAHVAWRQGKPDVELAMPDPQTVGPGEMEKDVDVMIPTHFADTKWIKATDLLPGDPSIVRRATVSVDNGPLLSVWEPAHDVVSAPGGTAFRIPAGAPLHVRLHYKKPWDQEQATKSDRSTVGLYLTNMPLSGQGINEVTIDGADGDPAAPRTFSSTMTTGGRVLAVRPSLDQPYAAVEVNAVSAAGKHVPLLKLRGARPEWPRRYWLADPVELPAGATVEVKVTPGDPDSGPLMKAVAMPLAIGLDVAPQ